MPADTPAPADPTRPRVAALALLTLFGVAVCVLIAYPFLPALAWALALAVMAFPLHRRVEQLIPNPSAAAAATTTVVVLALGVPVVLVGGQLVREAEGAVTKAEAAANSGKVDEVAARVPSGPWALDWVRRSVDVEAEARNLVRRLAGDAALFAQGALGAALQTLVCVFVLYFSLRDRRRLLGAVRDLLPMTRKESDYLFTRVDDTIHATVYATLLEALVQGVSGGLVFWLAGLPNPLLWGVVMFALGVLPVVGAVLVWLPAGLWLLASDRFGDAALVLGWGVLWSGPVGNWLYAYLAGGRMRLHAVPVLVAYVGGLAVFGMSGMVLGPVAVAVTLGLVDVWHRRLHPEEGRELEPAAVPEPTGRLVTA